MAFSHGTSMAPGLPTDAVLPGTPAGLPGTLHTSEAELFVVSGRGGCNHDGPGLHGLRDPSNTPNCDQVECHIHKDLGQAGEPIKDITIESDKALDELAYDWELSERNSRYSQKRESVLRKELIVGTIKAMKAQGWTGGSRHHGEKTEEDVLPKISVNCDALRNAVDLNGPPSKSSKKCLLDHNGSFIRKWDCMTMLGLSYTAVVTPVEVAFVEQENSGLFFLNQLITLIFATDMILQFFLPYETLGVDGIQVVKHRRDIAMHYLKGWFVLDLFSIIPLDSVGSITGSTAMEKLKVVRFVRLLRLLKMFRLFRASRILTRWQTRLAVPYSLQSMLKFVMMLIVGAHWIGCCWGLIGVSIEGYSWVDALQDSKPLGMQVIGDPLHLYLASLHFAIMTITSIGYGDISPQQAIEYVFVVILQCLGGMLWAYSMGEVMGVISNLNPAGTLFKQTMDQLNIMMRDHSLNPEMQRNLRSFFLQAKELHQAERYSDLLQQMSPKLQGEVARVTNMRWISKVWYLRPKTEGQAGVSDVFIARLAVSLKSRVYAQSEVIRSDDTLHVLTRGVAQWHRNFLRSGSAWGEDFILDCKQLRRTSFVLAYTFVEVQEVTGKTMWDIAESCSVYGDDRFIRKAVVKLAFLRGFVNFAKKYEEVKQKMEDKKQKRQLRNSVSHMSIESAGSTNSLGFGGSNEELRVLVREEVRQVIREELALLRSQQDGAA